MKKRDGVSAVRERILDTAERLFGTNGYDAVTLRDIGSVHGITHATLYHHFPGGKDEMFAEVTERSIRRHGRGLDDALVNGGTTLREKLSAAAGWLLSRPPMDLLRMVETDLKRLPEDTARKLMFLVYELLIVRLRKVFDEAREAGIIGETDTGLVAGSVIAIVESLFSIPDFGLTKSRREMADYMIDVLLKGLGYDEGEKRERT